MRTFLKTTLAVIWVFLLSDVVSANTIVRIAHAIPENTPIHQSLVHFQKIVEQRSNGAIEVKIYQGGQLGSVNETVELVQLDNLQMSLGASVLLNSVVPEFNVLDSFYIFRDLQHARTVLDGPGGDMILDAMEDKGLKGMGFFGRGFRHFSNSRAPLNSVESFQGLRMRSAANPTQIEAWRAVGAAPMPLNWGEIYTSLQQGLIDGQESALSSMYTQRFFEVQDYVSLTGHIYTAEVWVAGKDFWYALNEKEKRILSEAADETIALQRKLTEKENDEAVEILKAKGLKFNDVGESVKSRLSDRLNGAVKDAIVDKVGRDFYDKFMSYL